MAVRRRVHTRIVGLAAAAVAATAFTSPAHAEPRKGHAATQRAVDAMVADGIPGITAEAVDKGRLWQGTSGVGNLKTGTPRGADDRFRTGSVTKTFVATVLLQMEAEGRLDLDDTVERWLPGLVRGNGNDDREITVGQLLNHTSGLFNYTSDPEFAHDNLLEGFSHTPLRHPHAAGTDTGGAVAQAGLHARHQALVLQHRLRPGRVDHREGQRQQLPARDP